MKNVRTIFTVLLLGAIGLTAFAAGGHKLFVLLKDGTLDAFLLKEKPVVTFDGEHVSIKSSVMTLDSAYVYADIEKFYFDVVQDEIIDTTQVDPPIIDTVEELTEEKEASGFSFAYDGRYAQIKGLGMKAQVAVFSVDGKRMQPKTVATPTTVTISMYELPTGIYIVRSGQRSIKIIRK